VLSLSTSITTPPAAGQGRRGSFRSPDFDERGHTAMRIAIAGTGYVGLVTGTCLATTGHDVTCVDVDEEKVARLRQGLPTIFEPSLPEMIRRNIDADRLHFTTSREEAYREAETIFICVGTPPTEDGAADLSAVFAVAGEIASVLDALGRGQAPKLIVVKSTVPVGTTQRVAAHIRSLTDAPFHIANNPEFLKEGSAVNDFLKPDRVVCGVEDPEAAVILRELYEPFLRQGHPNLIVDIASSEMVKYASNAMLACKISFINEIANLCELCGADIKAVRQGMATDQRIGSHFLHAGLGYGGSCFPKDTLAVVDMGRTLGLDCKIMSAVHEVNQEQRSHFWNKVVGHFGPDLRGRSFAVWGVAFKPETDDIREAPSLAIIDRATESGARVRAFDPVAADNLRAERPQVEIVDDMYEALDGCDALIICTEWSEFRRPDLREISQRLAGLVIFDGRNILPSEQLREHGFTYYSIGRPPVHPEHAAAAAPSRVGRTERHERHRPGVASGQVARR
jgi:UDPglucose 6-dehydrogenase